MCHQLKTPFLSSRSFKDTPTFCFCWKQLRWLRDLYITHARISQVMAHFIISAHLSRGIKHEPHNTANSVSMDITCKMGVTNGSFSSLQTHWLIQHESILEIKYKYVIPNKFLRCIDSENTGLTLYAYYTSNGERDMR